MEIEIWTCENTEGKYRKTNRLTSLIIKPIIHYKPGNDNDKILSENDTSSDEDESLEMPELVTEDQWR